MNFGLETHLYNANLKCPQKLNGLMRDNAENIVVCCRNRDNVTS